MSALSRPLRLTASTLLARASRCFSFNEDWTEARDQDRSGELCRRPRGRDLAGSKPVSDGPRVTSACAIAPQSIPEDASRYVATVSQSMQVGLPLGSMRHTSYSICLHGAAARPIIHPRLDSLFPGLYSQSVKTMSTGPQDIQPKEAIMPQPIPECLTPVANYENCVNIGVAKAGKTFGLTFVSGILAGCFISLGGFFAIMVAGNMAGVAATNLGLIKLTMGLLFPLGLSMVMLSGVELFTGNTAVVAMAYIENKVAYLSGVIVLRVSMSDMLKNFAASWAGNLVGSLFIAWMAVQTGVLAGCALPIAVATAKTSLSLGPLMARAIIANWMVCIGVWQANMATSLTGKLMGLWLPVAAFVTLGMEHSVANMFFIPTGMMLGADVSVSAFVFNNLIPVTIGNTIAGMFFTATFYSLCYGSLKKKWLKS